MKLTFSYISMYRWLGYFVEETGTSTSVRGALDAAKDRQRWKVFVRVMVDVLSCT